MYVVPLAISTLGLILIILAVVFAIALILGFLGARTRDRRLAGVFDRDVAEADSALQQAAALDRGWNREAMTSTVREALSQKRPGWAYHDLHLVLVDDRPGVQEDRAQFVAVGEDGAEARVVLARDGDVWRAESVD
ncbi:MAG TPA: hypothetical protein VHJ37_10845 [Thermoleophilaceae bacterium]|jgi:hypothetical protein|nr:hypothetical protein [Thermoleophilaceae bacterium]